MASESSITIGDRDIDPVRGGLLFLFIGLAVTGYGGYDYFQQEQAIDTAVSVDATIIETGVESDSTGSSTSTDYYPTVRFEYTYQGQSYTSTNVYPATVRPSYDTQSAAMDVVDEYETNSTATAYIPPESPGDAFLKNQRSNGPVIAVGIGVISMLFGGRSLFIGYRKP
ncbi:DUF3592 domain-containing protein [Natrinema versiforme]|uniref:DUF3592 domain-containing protein n=1 Tax=Natrinema versiforme JCM 10478 TaxID=1227496 RepID=L9XQU0_9EURY|nr:DUF3592 domain-containing protein [Natrinema versiforme]ELY62968.1 hypothetical protein C489_20681 [Natrinema versiforme JCM 10478]